MYVFSVKVTEKAFSSESSFFFNLEVTRMLVALRATHARRHCAFGELRESEGTSGQPRGDLGARPWGDLRAASKRSQCSLGLRPQHILGTYGDLG